MIGPATRPASVLLLGASAVLLVAAIPAKAVVQKWNAPFADIDFQSDYSYAPTAAASSFVGSDFVMTYQNNSAVAKVPGTLALGNTARASDSAYNAAVFAAMNAGGTPWVELTFVDNKSNTADKWAGIELFINGIGVPSHDPRIVAGASFPLDSTTSPRWRTADSPNANNLSNFGNNNSDLNLSDTDPITHNGYYTEMKQSNPGTQSTPNYLVNSGSAVSLSTTPGFNDSYAGIGPSLVQRVEGTEVKVRVAESSDGTITVTYTLDGVAQTPIVNPYYTIANGGLGPFAFNAVTWRVVGGGADGNEAYVFKNLVFPATVPEPASLGFL